MIFGRIIEPVNTWFTLEFQRFLYFFFNILFRHSVYEQGRAMSCNKMCWLLNYMY